VYNRALSSGEIQAIYNAGSAGKCPNHPPTAGNANAATVQNQSVGIPVERLLLFASDPDGDPLTLSSVSATSTNGGTVVIVTNAVVYEPVTNYVGADRFTYMVSDGRGGTASAFVLVQVRPANQGAGNLLPPSAIPGGYTLSFAGIPGRTYNLQRAASVNGPWSVLAAVTVDFSGIGSYSDTNAPPTDAYYRVEYP
jgi:hypothetical protein